MDNLNCSICTFENRVLPNIQNAIVFRSDSEQKDGKGKLCLSFFFCSKSMKEGSVLDFFLSIYHILKISVLIFLKQFHLLKRPGMSFSCFAIRLANTKSSFVFFASRNKIQFAAIVYYFVYLSK